MVQAESKLRRRLSGSVGYARAKDLTEEVSLKGQGGGWRKIKAIGKMGGFGGSPPRTHDPEVVEVEAFLSSVLAEHGVEQHGDDEFYDTTV